MDTPLFDKEKIDEIEKLLQDIAGDNREESSKGPRASHSCQTAPVRRQSERELRKVAEEERERHWRQHIENVHRYLDAQKKPTLDAIKHKRKFREAKRLRQHRHDDATGTVGGPGQYPQPPEAKRELFAAMLITSDDIDEYMDEKLSGPLPSRLMLFPS